MGDNETVNVRFILRGIYKNEDESAKEMLLCFQRCVENKLKPTWIKEDCCLSINPSKTDAFILEKFEGEAFAYLCTFKCVILGPWALSACLADGSPIPKSGNTIFTTAMRDCYISCSHTKDEEKTALEQKITWMGGIVDSKRLIVATTHLIAGSTRSLKYKRAIEANIPVMTSQWVNAVWDASLERNIHATDKEFKKFKCPPFHGLVITVSNVQKIEKEKLKVLIKTGGGVFSPELVGGVTSILVVNGNKSEKYTHARSCEIPCVDPTWLYESSKLGYAVDVTPHEVGPQCQSSTPAGNSNHAFEMSHISAISHCAGSASKKVVVNETVLMDNTTISNADASLQPLASHTTASSRLSELLGRLDMKKVKSAGHFLDGCKVFLSGFGSQASDRLRRVLNAGGATRFNEISDSVSHVIVGNTSLGDIEEMLQTCPHRPFVVTVEWLLESIDVQSRANEEKYELTAKRARTTNPEPPSPSLKKSLQMLRTPSVPPLVLGEKGAVDHDLEAAGQLIPQYLNKDNSSDMDGTLFKIPPQKEVEPLVAPADVNDTNSLEDEDSQMTTYFEGLKFLIVGFEDEDRDKWSQFICSVGGEVVANTFRGVPDFGIVPFKGTSIRHATKEVVSDLWLESCAQLENKVPIEYYHLPIAVPSVKPLVGCVIGISAYALKERDYLVLLCEVLGAIHQDVFARKNNPAKNALGSTHLICPEPGSSKYIAAVKWKIPAVTHKWLLACLRERRLVEVDRYCVTETTVLSPTLIASPAAILVTDKATPCQASVPQLSIQPLTPLNSTSSTSTPAKDESRLYSRKESNSLANSNNGHEENRAENTVEKHSTNPSSSTSTKLSITPVAANKYGFSQETPIRFPRLSTAIPRRGSSSSRGSPGALATPEIATPDLPCGFNSAPSPNTRKATKRWIDKFPVSQNAQPEAKKRKSTPYAEIYKKCWEKWTNLSDEDDPGNQARTASPEHRAADSSSVTQTENIDDAIILHTETAGANTQLNQLNQLLQSSQVHDAENANKLVRRPSLMESSSAAKLAPLARSATDDKAIVTDVSDSQSNEIGWAYHSQRRESREVSTGVPDRNSSTPKLIDEGYTSRSKNISSAVSDGSNSLPVTLHKEPKIFILSTMSNNDREMYKGIVTALGGTVSLAAHFETSATHLVCIKPARSEKLLACVASGRWVLHVSYLDKSKLAGHFLPEESYEFGNPAATSNLPVLTRNSLELRLGAACYRWRVRLSENASEKGAYDKMRAIVWTNPDKVDSFKRLLAAGGGTIIDARPPFAEPTTATHLFIDSSKTKDFVDYQALHDNGVLCLPLLFLNNFLMENPTPIAADHVVPECLRLGTRHSTRNRN